MDITFPLHLFLCSQVRTQTPRMPWRTWPTTNLWPSWGRPLPLPASWTTWTTMARQRCTTRAAGTTSCRLPSGHQELSTAHLREQVGQQHMWNDGSWARQCDVRMMNRSAAVVRQHISDCMVMLFWEKGKEKAFHTSAHQPHMGKQRAFDRVWHRTTHLHIHVQAVYACNSVMFSHNFNILHVV